MIRQAKGQNQSDGTIKVRCFHDSHADCRRTTMEPLSPSRIVRFDTECVLIPDAQPAGKLPFVLTKSYSLPLWRKDDDEEPRLVIKVPIPQ